MAPTLLLTTLVKPSYSCHKSFMAYGHSVNEWLVFHFIILILLGLDLGVFNRKAHVIRMKEALLWSLLWIIIGLSFSFYIYSQSGSKAAIEYVTGYIVEKSLSVDNLFVFLLIFASLKIPRIYQHRLLFWGVLGAIILRGIMIYLGTQLLENFHFVIYLFGGFLIYTGFKIFKGGDSDMDPRDGFIFKTLSKILPLDTREDFGGHFTIKKSGKTFFTMGFVALVLIETSDVIFALDSVPAVFGVTRDPYIVYTSNIFAILGLRSLFFVLEDLLYRFYLLKAGLAVILIFVGAKMCLEAWIHVEPWISLGIIGAILAASVGLSLLFPKDKIKPKDTLF